MIKKIIYIEGMSCSNCQRRVEEGLERKREVREVKVDLREKKAEVLLNSNLSDRELKETIEDLGYRVKEINRVISSNITKL